MIIGEKEYNNVTITDNDGNVFAIVTDENIVEHRGFHVVFDVGIDLKQQEANA